VSGPGAGMEALLQLNCTLCLPQASCMAFTCPDPYFTLQPTLVMFSSSHAVRNTSLLSTT